MNSKFESSEIHAAEFDTSNAGFTRELILQYIAAGIVFPDGVRHAEQMLRKISVKDGRS